MKINDLKFNTLKKKRNLLLDNNNEKDVKNIQKSSLIDQ